MLRGEKKKSKINGFVQTKKTPTRNVVDDLGTKVVVLNRWTIYGQPTSSDNALLPCQRLWGSAIPPSTLRSILSCARQQPSHIFSRIPPSGGVWNLQADTFTYIFFVMNTLSTRIRSMDVLCHIPGLCSWSGAAVGYLTVVSFIE